MAELIAARAEARLVVLEKVGFAGQRWLLFLALTLWEEFPRLLLSRDRSRAILVWILAGVLELGLTLCSQQAIALFSSMLTEVLLVPITFMAGRRTPLPCRCTLFLLATVVGVRGSNNFRKHTHPLVSECGTSDRGPHSLILSTHD